MVTRWIDAAGLGAWWGRPASPADAAQHIALGTFCHAASALREAGLRRWTGPFDWVFSTPAMIAECLEDDFDALLDPRRLRAVPAAERTHGAARQCRHVEFEARYGLPTIFNHHDPSVPGPDRRALERAVGRMRAALARPGRNVLYMLSEYAWPEAELAPLAERLAGYPSRNLLCVIEVAGGAGPPGAGWSGDGERRLGIRLVTATRSQSVRFGDPADDALLRQTLLAVAARAGVEPAPA